MLIIFLNIEIQILPDRAPVNWLAPIITIFLFIFRLQEILRYENEK